MIETRTQSARAESSFRSFTPLRRSAENGFTPLRRSAENGFTPLRRSAENGFTPLKRSAENGFTPLKRSAENGFTLVELMVVIVILALLSVIVAVNVLPQLGRAKSETARIDITNLDQAMELYRLNNLNYPSTADGLGALVKAPPSLTDPSRYQVGGYIKKLPKDPWGRDYRFESPGKHGAYDIYTLGADGKEGGTGENADIGNWQ